MLDALVMLVVGAVILYVVILVIVAISSLFGDRLEM